MEEKTWDVRDAAAMVVAAITITIALLFPIAAPVRPSSTRWSSHWFCGDDEVLVERVASFVAQMIAFSEPAGSDFFPEPDLVEVDLDYDALDAAEDSWDECE